MTRPVKAVFAISVAMKFYVVLPLFVGLCAGAVLNFSDEDGSDLPMQNPDLFQGDILGIKDSQDRNIVPQSYRRWPGGKIPYVINEELALHEDKIKAAMKHYEEKTCITFIPRTDEKQYVNIFAGDGCFSHVGKTIGSQPLSLGPGCYAFGTIVHELGHAIGFYHEHSRSDRDDYIDVHWDNIQTGKESEFEKLRPKQNLLLDNFDYNSVMLYGETVFSKDHFSGLKTMTAKNPEVILLDVYKKKGLSDSDIFRIKKMYNC